MSEYVVESGHGDMDLVIGMGVVCVDCGLVVGRGVCWSLLLVCSRFVLVLVGSSCLVVFGGIVLLRGIAGV